MARTKEQNEARDELYQYVRGKIMGYDENMPLTRSMIHMLDSLFTGKEFNIKGNKSMFSFTYEEILITFKFCSQDILRAITNKTFNNENKKFSYIMAIINNNINDVVKRINDVKRQKEKAKTMEDNSYLDEELIFTKGENKLKERLKDFW